MATLKRVGTGVSLGDIGSTQNTIGTISSEVSRSAAYLLFTLRSGSIFNSDASLLVKHPFRKLLVYLLMFVVQIYILRTLSLQRVKGGVLFHYIPFLKHPSHISHPHFRRKIRYINAKKSQTYFPATADLALANFAINRHRRSFVVVIYEPAFLVCEH